MVNCKEIYRLLSDFIDDELDYEFEREIEQHLNTCKCCLSLINTFRKTINLFNEIETIEVPEKTHKQLWKAIRIEIYEKKIITKRRLK